VRNVVPLLARAGAAAARLGERADDHERPFAEREHLAYARGSGFGNDAEALTLDGRGDRSFYRNTGARRRHSPNTGGGAKDQTAPCNTPRHRSFCLAGKGSAVRIRYAPPENLDQNAHGRSTRTAVLVPRSRKYRSFAAQYCSGRARHGVNEDVRSFGLCTSWTWGGGVVRQGLGDRDR
jgi:hypothetical protein